MSNSYQKNKNEYLCYGNLGIYKILEKTHEGKVEYANGTILLSSNTSINHNLIIKRLLIEKDNHLLESQALYLKLYRKEMLIMILYTKERLMLNVVLKNIV